MKRVWREPTLDEILNDPTPLAGNGHAGLGSAVGTSIYDGFLDRPGSAKVPSTCWSAKVSSIFTP